MYGALSDCAYQRLLGVGWECLFSSTAQIKKPARQRREQNFRAPIPKKVSMKIQIENLEKKLKIYLVYL